MIDLVRFAEPPESLHHEATKGRPEHEDHEEQIKDRTGTVVGQEREEQVSAGLRGCLPLSEPVLSAAKDLPRRAGRLLSRFRSSISDPFGSFRRTAASLHHEATKLARRGGGRQNTKPTK